MKSWSIEKLLTDMDRAGIATAMLSVTTPAVNFTKGDTARKPCRKANEYGAKLVADYPMAANCRMSLAPTQSPVMIEFGTDTTRAIVDIVFSGNARRFPDVCWIFSHAGWTMPFLIERFARHPLLVPKAKETVLDGTLAELKRFFYDTAQTSNRGSMSALAAIIPPSQIVFGTDFPYRTGIDHVKGLREAGVFTEEQVAAIERGNALKLLSRFRGGPLAHRD
jgi:Amidohydrolase